MGRLCGIYDTEDDIMDGSPDFLKLAAERYSVRSFLDKPVERAVIDRILEAGRLAPTACNRQPQRILVIDGEQGREKLKKCTVCHFNAPAALLICYDKNECWVRDYDQKNSGDIDASIVACHMMLAAHSLGVGMTWVMYFIPEAVREEFSIPENMEPVALLIMGYPAPDVKPFPAHSQFKPAESMVYYNSFK